MRQPFVDLPDFVLQHCDRSGASIGKPVSQDSLSDAVGLQGLELDQDTVADGNCGLDAILKNLERLQEVAHPEAAKFLELLRRKGRGAALLAMRLRLLIWIRDNRGVVVIPETSLEQLVTMGEYGSLSQYIEAMKKDHTWIDTPMLIAASAVFRIQMICFVGRGEAHLLAAPEIADLTVDVPVAFIAHSSNVHFYACRPAVEGYDVELGEVDHDDLLLSSLQVPADDGRIEEPSEGQHSRGTDPGSLDAQGTNLFLLCKCLNAWDPFGKPDEQVLAALKAIEGGQLSDTAAVVLDVLRYRDAVKMRQWEALEADLDRECVYRVAKKALAKPSSYGTYNIFKKSKNIFGKLELSKIE